MQLLDSVFDVGYSLARRIGRLQTSSHPEIEAAVLDALRAAEFEIVPIEFSDWQLGNLAFTTIYLCETWQTDHHLMDPKLRDGIGDDIAQILSLGEMFLPQLEAGR